MILIDYDRVKECSKRRMAIEELCALLDYDEDEFRAEMETDPLIKIALNKGKAEAIESASMVIEMAYTGLMAGNDKDEFRLKAALSFLDRHAMSWRKAK